MTELSTCCNAPPLPETDVCSSCKEHTPFYEDGKPSMNKDNWQPIATAPKDGSPILACNIEREYAPKTIYWAAYHPNATGKMCWRDSKICGNKMNGVTHFQPLPPPPDLG